MSKQTTPAAAINPWNENGVSAYPPSSPMVGQEQVHRHLDTALKNFQPNDSSSAWFCALTSTWGGGKSRTADELVSQVTGESCGWIDRTGAGLPPILNLDQVEGPFDHLRTTANEQASTFEQFEQADELIAATGADIRKGVQAAYIPSGDFITLPPKESFDSAADFAETAFHELAHWTEPPHRLNWDRSGEGYAMGELRAEIAACYVATELGIPHSGRLDKSAAYIQHWLRALENDNRAIFRASSQASRAADYLLSFVRTSEDRPAPSEAEAGTC